MIRLFKYLKPYTLMILLTIALLFLQANADLALPDYMSKIVNNGIQQGGVENSIPQAIRQAQMDRLLLFMTPSDSDRVLNRYILVDQKSPDYNLYVEKYPALADEPIYLLKSIEVVESEWLNPVMGKALLTLTGIEKATSDPAQAAALFGSLGVDPAALPAGMDIFSALKAMPVENRAQVSAAIQKQFAVMDVKLINQAAVQVVKSEYLALGMNTNKLQNDYILKMGLIMLLVTLLSVACAVSVGFLSARTAAGVARDLRKQVFQKVESFSNAEFDHFSTASLITRSTNDITQIQMVVIMMMRMVFYAPIMGVGGIIRAIDKSASMWWIIAVAVAMLISLVVTVFSLSLPKFKIMQTLIDRLNLVVRENLSGMMVIRAFNMQPFEESRFDKANQELTSTNLFISRVMAGMFPTMNLIMSGLSLMIIWVGAHQVAQSNMQVGDMMAFLQYAMQIVFSFLMMSFMFIILPRASVSAARIAEVLDAKASILDSANPTKFRTDFRGTIEFQNVSFRYPNAEEDVLKNINFTARPGQTTALIGSTGSGKTTIVNLIPRFYDVTEGSILVDGIDIRKVTQHDLREKIGYIPQKSMLFSGTIESNLLYADENADPAILQEAAEIAQAQEFIEARPEGLKAEISQGGTNVSGGQRQRLSIARALVKRAPIYIFDDSFSALDFKTDSALRKAMKDKTASSTVLIVTQRVSTIKNADQILVIDEGEIVGKGTHSQLMTDCETYREIALSQLSMEELA